MIGRWGADVLGEALPEDAVCPDGADLQGVVFQVGQGVVVIVVLIVDGPADDVIEDLLIHDVKDVLDANAGGLDLDVGDVMVNSVNGDCGGHLWILSFFLFILLYYTMLGRCPTRGVSSSQCYANQASWIIVGVIDC